MTSFVYGTAWKEDETRRLVGLALAQGFRAIDTANQRRHYHEAAVGEALADAYAAGVVRREDLFLQTKFTHRGGQDHRLPYDANAPVAAQVRQSLESSLQHLGARVVDSYVLHGPSQRVGLAREDLEAWEAMEELHAAGLVRALAVSNVTRAQLELLLGRARVTPSAVQNRCYASQGWDREMRALCRERGIAYQGFSLLTANRRETALPAVRALATRHGLTPSQLVFRFALDAGMTPLTGTSSAEHMRADLAVLRAPPLPDADVRAIEAIAG
ncbi:MAG: aldo/keto reductase [Labilithrix sp.]|nr:aldo/keto reductase [Labilithrix sp.]MCW5813140.1 aldo/keto reductase [Labilithrix sp.]